MGQNEQPGTKVRVAQRHNDDPQGVPRLPHEQDESADSQQSRSASHQVGEKAFDDVQQGRVDTDKGPVFDQMRNDKASPVHVASPQKKNSP